MKLRILLADDHEIVRRGLCALLQKHEGWEVCGEASDGRQLFYDLGTASFSYPATSGFFLTPVYQNVVNNVHFEGNIARAGVNYHF